MNYAIDVLDDERVRLNGVLVNKSTYSQYLTPVSVARFMASLFDETKFNNSQILDAGAGMGTLTAALLERLDYDQKAINTECTLVEVDNLLGSRIPETLKPLVTNTNVKISVIEKDFIEWGTKNVDEQVNLFNTGNVRFSHAILNPPYQKINSNSDHRKLLRSVGIETVNLYTAFVALAIKLLKPGGQLVAIIPRSFCNGPYYKPFRKLLLEETAIKQIHLFESRNKAFKDDDVLQENVIFKLERGCKQGDVKISTSTDARFMDYKEDFYPFEKVVRKDDLDSFISIPTSHEKSVTERYPSLRSTLKDLGITVSTGPVVGFRVKEHLRMTSEKNTVPLLYPTQIEQECVNLLKETKKPTSIMKNEVTEKWLYPNGYYLILRRRTSKEEVKRIISAVTVPDKFDAPFLGFENGLNVLHVNKNGLSKELGYGLHVYMNSTLFDDYFRLFNGHTQVNATDLRSMYFPSQTILKELGTWYLSLELPVVQEVIDSKLEEVL